jgi:uncharacterized membrane protein
MTIHPLKFISLLAATLLIATQFGLLYWMDHPLRFYLALALALPLLVPLQGLYRDRRYTFKWVGFLTLLYFSIGISEWFANPELKFYALLCIVFSVALFLSSIYYSSYQRFKD